VNLDRYHAYVREFYCNVTNNGGNVSPSTLTALSIFVSRLIRSGLWAKIDELYPLCGRGLASACVKLKYVNTPFMTNHNFVDEDFEEWGPGAGLSPDGTTKYLDTNFPATSLRDDAHLCYIEQQHVTPGTGTETALGVIGGGLLWTIGADIGNTDRRAILGDPSSQAIVSTAYADWTSFYIANREASNSLRLFKRTHLKDTDTVVAATSPKPSLNLFLAADNNGGVAANFFRNRLRFASIGQALTPAEVIDYYQFVQALQDSLGRTI
jgi:hypothetical protein